MESTSVPYGILGIVVGAVFLFFGIKIFRCAVGLAGFAAFGAGAYILAGQVFISLNLQRPADPDLLRLGISILAAIVGGFISVWLWKVALVSLGVLGGLGAALYLMSWKTNGLISKPTHRTILITVLGVLGGVCSLFFENAIIILGTSIVGAIGLCYGIDVFAKTGFNDALATLIKNKGSFKVTGASYGLLASCGAAAALGMLTQYLLNRKASAKPPPYK